MTGRLLMTPWTRRRISPVGQAAIRERIPAGYSLHLSGRSANGPWTVRLFRHAPGATSVEVVSLSDYPDLGYAVDFALAEVIA